MSERYTQEIEMACRKMRISTNLAKMAQTTTGESHQEYLLKLLQSELALREHSRKERYIKSAGFDQIKTLEQFDFSEVTLPDGLNPDALASCDFIRSASNLVMYGGIGTGKTHLSIALGVAACNAGFRVKFYRTSALMNHLTEAKAAGTLGVLRKRIQSCDLLILDEFGYVPYDLEGSRLLFELVSERYEQRSILLNTNHEFSKWVNIMLDEEMTIAMIDRLLHHCHLLIFSGQGRRLRTRAAVKEQIHKSQLQGGNIDTHGTV